MCLDVSSLVSSRGVIVGLDLSIHAEPRRENGRRFRNERLEKVAVGSELSMLPV